MFLLQLTIYYICSKHYQQVYRMLNVVAKLEHVYSAVGINRDMSIVPHLPYTDFVTSSESKQVESYIRNTVDFSDTIQEGSVLSV